MRSREAATVLFAALWAPLAILGCNSNSAPAPQQFPPPAGGPVMVDGNPPPMGVPGGGPGASAATANMTAEQALTKVTGLDAGLIPLQGAMNSAEAKLKRDPRAASARAAYVDATYKYGDAVMNDRGKMTPAIQYRAALALFRRALKVDPGHQPSLQDKNLIEGIYQQMGRPVPK